MGRGAGNAETELLLAIFKTKNLNISNYEIDGLLEDFEKMRKNLKWGSSFLMRTLPIWVTHNQK